MTIYILTLIYILLHIYQFHIMKKLLWIPTYSLWEIIAQDTPELPKNIFWVEMKNWIEKMGGISNPEYIQTWIWKTVVRDIRNCIECILDTIEYSSIHFGIMKIDNNLSGKYEDSY